MLQLMTRMTKKKRRGKNRRNTKQKWNKYGEQSIQRKIVVDWV
jgi:hypothetical protein